MLYEVDEQSVVLAPEFLACWQKATAPFVVAIRTPTDYIQMDRLQAAVLQHMPVANHVPVIFVHQHQHVITLGRAATVDFNSLPTKTPVVRSRRGGQITVHAPGQLIAYPIVSLRQLGLSIGDYVCALERALLEVAKYYGIAAHCRKGFIGLWTPRGKMASIGIAVRHGIAWHGLALYVADQQPWFGNIHPCGLDNVVADALQFYCPQVTIEHVTPILIQELTKQLWQKTTPPEAALTVETIDALLASNLTISHV